VAVEHVRRLLELRFGCVDGLLNGADRGVYVAAALELALIARLELGIPRSLDQRPRLLEPPEQRKELRYLALEGIDFLPELLDGGHRPLSPQHHPKPQQADSADDPRQERLELRRLLRGLDFRDLPLILGARLRLGGLRGGELGLPSRRL